MQPGHAARIVSTGSTGLPGIAVIYVNFVQLAGASVPARSFPLFHLTVTEVLNDKTFLHRDFVRHLCQSISYSL